MNNLNQLSAVTPRDESRPSSRALSFDEQYRARVDAAIEAEDKAVKAIKRMARNNSKHLLALWNWGDGEGGGIIDMIADEIGKRQPSAPMPPTYKIVKGKKVIPADLRTKVFERDAYRCLHCNTHLGLTIDHIKPESKGGTLDFDNLQTLCRPCNSKKGVKL